MSLADAPTITAAVMDGRSRNEQYEGLEVAKLCWRGCRQQTGTRYVVMCVRSDARCRSALTPPVSGATRYRSALAPRLTTRPGPSSQVPIPPSAGACPGGAPAGGACGRTTLTRDGGRPPWRLRGRTAPGNWSHNSPARRSPSSASWLQNSPITGVRTRLHSQARQSRHGDAGRDRHQHARKADHGRQWTSGDRDHPGREDRLRRQQWLGRK